MIAIIAILAAILFPVFQKVRENARRASCQSNMKQLGMAITQYNQDFDETMIKLPTCQGWVYPMYSFIKSTGTMVCPDDTLQPTASTYVNSYSYNSDLYDGAGTNIPISLAKLNSPAQTVELCEASYASMRLNSSDQSTATDGFVYDCGAVLHTGYMGGRTSGYQAKSCRNDLSTDRLAYRRLKLSGR